ncbi:hypothetical protein CJU90_0271 [Yarrowia sp. C11]|nr:hypothetical protein CJU90_0271 [Yarrowia sp. C11]
MLSYTRVTPVFCEPGLVAYVFERKLIVRQFEDDISELRFALDLPGLFSQRVRCIEWRPLPEMDQDTEIDGDRSLLVASSDEVLFYSGDGMLLGQIKPDFGVAAVKWVTPEHICIISPNSLVADIYWIEPTQQMIGINHVILGVNSSFALTPCDIPFMACSQHGYIAIVCSLTPTTVWIWSIQDDAPVVHTVLCHDSEHTITALSWHPDKAVLMVQIGYMSSVWDMPAASGKHFPYRVKWLPRGMLLYDGQEFGLA